MRNKTADIIVYILIGTLYTWSIVCGILSCTVMSFEYTQIFLYVLGYLVVFGIIFYNKYTLIITSAILLLTLIFIGAYIWLSGDIPEYFVRHAVYLNRVGLFITGYLPYRTEYALTVLIALTGIASFFTALSLCANFNFILLSIFGIAAFGINIVLGYYNNSKLFLVFIFCLLVLLMKSLNLSNRELNKTHHSSNGLYTLAVMPICIIVILIASRIPVPGVKPELKVITTALETPFTNMSDAISGVFAPKFFSFQSTGFLGGDTRLGGNVSINYNFVMEVEADLDSPENNGVNYSPGLYLIGARKDIYTGFEWTSSRPEFTSYTEEDEEQRMLPLLEVCTGYLNQIHSKGYLNLKLLNSRNKDLNFDFYGDNIKSYKINLHGKRTGSVFSHMDYTDFSLDGYSMQKNGGGDLRTDPLMDKGSSYRFDYWDRKAIYEDTQEQLKSSRRGVLKEFQKLINDPEKPLDFTIHLTEKEYDLAESVEKLIVYSDDVYSRYLGIPETVPGRVRDLANDVVKDYKSDYEKAYALEQFVSKLEYTLTPGASPINRDFVDYFLFDGKKGYCTYFASAMAVMCRSVGLPARYVEGFVLPGNKNAAGNYDVTNSQAHAWVEVYFEGYGWQSFEPTSPYTGLSEFHSEDIVSAFANDPDDYDPYLEEDEYFPDDNEGVIPKDGREVMFATNPITSLLDSNPILFFAIASILTIILLVLIFTLYKYIKFRYYIKRLENLENRIAVREYFKRIVNLCGHFGEKMEKNETAMAFAERVGKRMAFCNEQVFLKDIAKIFSAAAYSQNTVTDKERELLKTVFFQLNAKLRSNCHILKYVYLKYIITK